jgi:hypothetical protein
VIQGKTTAIEEVSVVSHSGILSKLDVIKEHEAGSSRVEFQPEESGIHVLRIYSDAKSRELFSTFEIEVVDLSNLKISFENEIAYIGREFKIYGNLNLNQIRLLFKLIYDRSHIY